MHVHFRPCCGNYLMFDYIGTGILYNSSTFAFTFLLQFISMSQGRYTVGLSPEKHVLTNDHGLVVISVSEADSGRYDCLYRGQLVSSYHIAVDTHRLV